MPPVERMVEQGRRSLVHRGMKAKRLESGMRRVGIGGVCEARERAREWPERLGVNGTEVSESCEDRTGARARDARGSGLCDDDGELPVLGSVLEERLDRFRVTESDDDLPVREATSQLRVTTSLSRVRDSRRMDVAPSSLCDIVHSRQHLIDDLVNSPNQMGLDVARLLSSETRLVVLPLPLWHLDRRRCRGRGREPARRRSNSSWRTDDPCRDAS